MEVAGVEGFAEADPCPPAPLSSQRLKRYTKVFAPQKQPDESVPHARPAALLAELNRNTMKEKSMGFKLSVFQEDRSTSTGLSTQTNLQGVIHGENSRNIPYRGRGLENSQCLWYSYKRSVFCSCRAPKNNKRKYKAEEAPLSECNSVLLIHVINPACWGRFFTESKRSCFWSTWIKGTLWHSLSGAASALCFGFILWSPAATKEGAFIWVQQHGDLGNLPSLSEGCCVNVSEGYVSCLCLQPALQKPNRQQIIEGCFCQILNDSRAAEWPFYKSGTYLCEVTRQLLETLATFKIHVGGINLLF